MKRAESSAPGTEQLVILGDYFDRVWDGLPPFERTYWEGFIVWLLLTPAILKTWAGVDVQSGTIHRIVGGQEIWEPCAELKSLYQQLLRYAKFLRWKDPVLRDMIARCS